MEEQKNKRVLNIEISNDVKKVSITGKDGDEKVVMRQELSEDDIEMATGGVDSPNSSCPTANAGKYRPPHKATACKMYFH